MKNKQYEILRIKAWIENQGEEKIWKGIEKIINPILRTKFRKLFFKAIKKDKKMKIEIGKNLSDTICYVIFFLFWAVFFGLLILRT